MKSREVMAFEVQIKGILEKYALDPLTRAAIKDVMEATAQFIEEMSKK